MTTDTSAPDLLAVERLLGGLPNVPGDGRGFLNGADLWVSRAPARLDVMGGIADYSGAQVCEKLLGCGTTAVLQPRDDHTIRIRSVALDEGALPVETRTSLDSLMEDGAWISYERLQSMVRINPLTRWAGYVLGSIHALLLEEQVNPAHGFNLLLFSSVPLNAGVASSASVEIATIHAAAGWMKLALAPERLAWIGQRAENMVAGAPCGIMDQLAIAGGRSGTLSHILCRPGTIEGHVKIHGESMFVGINTKVRHSVAANPYRNVRAGAFMGKAIINELRQFHNLAPVKHLTELTCEEFNSDYAPHLPRAMKGGEFLRAYGTHNDPVTRIDPETVYRIAGPTRHPVEEHDRVARFVRCLREFDDRGEAACIEAGRCMFDSHESYRVSAELSAPEADYLVDEVHRAGSESGLYGAKITGGGGGGTVAVFGRSDAIRDRLPLILNAYQSRTGLTPDLCGGTAPGAVEFGVRHYTPDGAGWRRAAPSGMNA